MAGAFVGSLFPLYALPVFLACSLVGALLLRQVRLYLASEVDISRHPAVVAGIWLFAVVGMLTVLSPQSGMTRTGMLLLCGFLLQLGVMDAVSGWLPRPYTGACLCAGLLFSAAFSSEPVLRFMETGVMAVVMGAVCHHVNRNRPQLGVGDAWLLCAQVAWLGMVDVMTAAFLGLSGFMLWQWVAHRDFHRCGFLGPWLCVGCVPVIVERLYQPEWIL